MGKRGREGRCKNIIFTTSESRLFFKPFECLVELRDPSFLVNSYRVFLLPHDLLIAHVIAQRRSNSGIHTVHWVFVYSTHRRLGIARGILSAAARRFIHGCSSSLSQAMMVLMDARGKGRIVDTESVSTMFKWLSYGPNKGRYISKVYKSSFGLVIKKKVKVLLML